MNFGDEYYLSGNCNNNSHNNVINYDRENNFINSNCCKKTIERAFCCCKWNCDNLKYINFNDDKCYKNENTHWGKKHILSCLCNEDKNDFNCERNENCKEWGCKNYEKEDCDKKNNFSKCNRCWCRCFRF